MDSLEDELLNAAAKGCINSLQILLKDDPLILDRIGANYFNETPLHVAALLGHVDFVREIIHLRPQLVHELNPQRSSALHLASAKGHVDVVRALLSVDKGACLARDRNELTPLHLAVARGRLEVMKLLLHAEPGVATSVLHFCVEHSQLGALKFVVDSLSSPELINSRDIDGNAVLHLAVKHKQVETIKFLLSLPKLDVNATNHDGMTPLDILAGILNSDSTDNLIEDLLLNAQAQRSSPLHNHKPNKKKKKKKQHADWLEKKKSALMVVASLIATMAFQVGVNPPGGVTDQTSDSEHLAGSAIMAETHPPEIYISFYFVNTVGFVAALSVILLLMSGLPLRRRAFMWVLMVITWVAIGAVALAYSIAIVVLTPLRLRAAVVEVTGLLIKSWLALMVLCFVCHSVRLLVKGVRKWRRRRRGKVVIAPLV